MNCKSPPTNQSRPQQACRHSAGVEESIIEEQKAQTAFGKLTKGKQREYADYIAAAKRDGSFAKKIKQAQANARVDPHWEITIASRKSWRAAAWLLTYLERRDHRGKTKAS